MKVLAKTERPNEFEIQTKNLRDLKEDEVLLSIAHCGICGSDLHAAAHAKGYEFVPKPIVLGHEFSGTVVEVGSKKLGCWINRRVVALPGFYCGTCEQCKIGRFNICRNIKGIGLHTDGGMAEQIILKDYQLIAIPDNLSLEIAALTEPMSVAVHAVNRLGEALQGKDVLVQGCGIIGLFTAVAALEKGANVTLSGLQKDWNYRLSKAELFNLKTEIFDSVQEHSTEYDYVYECSGSNSATENSVKRIKKGGALVLVALYEKDVLLPINQMVRGEINILTTYGGLKEDFYDGFVILEKYENQFSQVIGSYELEHGQKAFEDARNQTVLKPVLKIQ